MKLFKNKFIRSGIAIAAFAFTASASAASFDFLTEASGNEHGGDPLVFMSDGVTLTASGYEFGVGTTYNAYLDQGAGLGVCKILDGGDQCAPASDDNVTLNEVLKIVLEGANTLKDLVFLNGSHGAVDSGAEILVRIGGTGMFSPFTFGALSMASLSGNIFEFMVDTDGNDFYIRSISAVPVPAAVLLFGSALLSMFGFSRRKSAKGNALAA